VEDRDFVEGGATLQQPEDASCDALASEPGSGMRMNEGGSADAVSDSMVTVEPRAPGAEQRVAARRSRPGWHHVDFAEPVATPVWSALVAVTAPSKRSSSS
jgi:hypothetical protein